MGGLAAPRWQIVLASIAAALIIALNMKMLFDVVTG
jgi:manganese transport protein